MLIRVTTTATGSDVAIIWRFDLSDYVTRDEKLRHKCVNRVDESGRAGRLSAKVLYLVQLCPRQFSSILTPVDTARVECGAVTRSWYRVSENYTRESRTSPISRTPGARSLSAFKSGALANHIVSNDWRGLGAPWSRRRADFRDLAAPWRSWRGGGNRGLAHGCRVSSAIE